MKEIINIYWEGPFSKNEIIEGKIDNNKFEVKSNDIGLYQIYGSHPLYGSNNLVYIGRTIDKNGFKSRLKNRWVIENGNDENNVQIYLGTIFSDSRKYNDEEKNNCIVKAEVLMINALKPAFNSSNIQSARKNSDNDYIIYNYGSYRSLYPIFDSEYYWEDFRNIQTVDKIAKEYNNKEIDNEDDYYGFIVDDKMKGYNIWFGVDYKIMDSKKHNCPLCLQVFTDDNKSISTLTNFIEFNEYDDGSSVSYIPLDINITKKEIDLKVKDTKSILQNKK